MHDGGSRDEMITLGDPLRLPPQVQPVGRANTATGMAVAGAAGTEPQMLIHCSPRTGCTEMPEPSRSI